MTPELWELLAGLWFFLAMSGFPCPCDCTEPCACTRCIDGEGPGEFEVVVAGIVEDPLNPFPCGDCESLNGTFVVACTGTNCFWRYQYPSTICNINYIRLIFGQTLGGDKTVAAFLSTDPGGTNVGTWLHNFGSPDEVDCKNISGLVIPFVGGMPGCDAFSTPATITITAL